MDVAPVLLPGWVGLLAWSGSLWALIGAARRAPWKKLGAGAFQHVFLGACVATMLLWSLRAGLSPGLAIHFVGATTLTLMFGWRLALVALAGVCAGLALAGLEPWPTLGVTYLVAGAVPVAVSWAVFRLADRYLPNLFFVYLFICAFLGAALAVVAMSLLLSLILLAAGVYGFEQLRHEYLGFLPLIAFPEAVLNGFVMTGMVALRPEWVCTFDDTRYLDGK